MPRIPGTAGLEALEVEAGVKPIRRHISLHSLEKEFNFLESLQPTKKSPEYWHNLGSSKSRNAQQKKLSREIIEDLISNCDVKTAVGFTVGLCLGNPGPCGARACLLVP